jgi:2-keto-4-pentenoate hydratase
MDHAIARMADFLAALRFERRPIEDMPPELRPQDIASAYAVQDALIERLLAHYGGRAVGYKIACTNTIAQQLLHTDAPVFGRLLSSHIYPSPARLKAGDFTLRVIEAEFAFTLARDVSALDVPYTSESIAPYVDRLLPSIEIVDHRLAGWDKFDVYCLIADNAIHGAWVPGAATEAWRGIDLAAHTVRLLVNGQTVETGSGAAVLGHPLEALAWLANELGTWGRTLRAGDRVTTGVCTNIYSADADDHVEADFGSLGRVSLTFEA